MTKKGVRVGHAQFFFFGNVCIWASQNYSAEITAPTIIAQEIIAQETIARPKK